MTLSSTPHIPQFFRARYEAALEAAKRDPRNAPAMLTLAEEVAGAGHTSAAATILNETRPLLGQNHGALLRTSILLDSVGDKKAAIEAAYAASALRPTDSAGELHLGALLMGENRMREAVEPLARHVSLPGTRANGWYMLSVALHQSGELRRAIEAGERAVALDPTEAQYVLHTQALLSVLGRFGDAVEMITTFLAVDARHASLWRSLSGLHEVLGDMPAALDTAERAVALAPEDAAIRAHRDHVLALSGPAWAPSQDMAAWSLRDGPRRRDAVVAKPHPVRLFSAWCRKISHLMVWEMQTRFAHSRLGYVWGVAEPIGHVATIGVVFAIANSGVPPVGDNLFLYYVTGVCLYMGFQRGAEETAATLAASRSLLMLPNVRPLDAIVARTGVSGLTDAISLIVLVGGLGLTMGSQVWPTDFAVCMLSILLAMLMGCGTGMVNMVIRSFFSSWEYIWQFVSRFLYFLSGIYFSPLAMPNELREILIWNPMLQIIELFRSGFYPGYDPPWLDISYTVSFVGLTLLFGLALQRVVLRRLLAGVAG